MGKYSCIIAGCEYEAERIEDIKKHGEKEHEDAVRNLKEWALSAAIQGKGG